MQTYFDVLSRIEMQLPVVTGFVLSAVAWFSCAHPFDRYASIVEILGWLYILYALSWVASQETLGLEADTKTKPSVTRGEPRSSAGIILKWVEKPRSAQTPELQARSWYRTSVRHNQIQAKMSTKRTYLDPIHQDIILDRSKPAERLVMDLIDTKEFQRLRRVHQLGASFFTFQGAEGSRFTHSVGVMHVASKLVDMLSDRSPGIEEKRALILSSALLHDIGHGPFSHVTEKILNYDHEDWSCKIIDGDSDVRKVLEAFDKNLARDVVSVLKKTYHPKYISHMVSSQLDCDRFDYLLRDSYMTGTAYGLFALHRILASMELDEENERILVCGDKGQIAVEDYLFARYSMYAQVYYHRKNLAARCLIAKLVKRARFLMESGKQTCFMDDATEKWLQGIDLSVAEYLTLDDVQMTYHIKRWSLDSDPILADLASRFLNRRLFKAMKIFRPRSLPPDSREAVASLAETFGGRSEAGSSAGHSGSATATQLRRASDKITVFASAKASAIEKKAREICAESGMDPDYYIDTESTGIRPYDYYRPEAELPQTNIVVKTDSGEVDELSNLSLAVEALVKGNYETRWLIYPAELDDKISNLNDLEI